MQNSTMEYASWQRPLYGFEISQNQAKTPLKSGFSDGLGGAVLATAQSTHRKPAANRQAAQRISAICEGERRHNAFVSGLFLL